MEKRDFTGKYEYQRSNGAYTTLTVKRAKEHAVDGYRIDWGDGSTGFWLQEGVERIFERHNLFEVGSRSDS